MSLLVDHMALGCAEFAGVGSKVFTAVSPRELPGSDSLMRN